MDLQAGGALVAVDEYEGCVMARCFLVMGLRWMGRPGLGCLLRSVIPGRRDGIHLRPSATIIKVEYHDCLIQFF